MKILKFSLVLLAIVAIGSAIGFYAGHVPKMILPKSPAVAEVPAETEVAQTPQEQTTLVTEQPVHERATVSFHFEPVLAANPNKQ